MDYPRANEEDASGDLSHVAVCPFDPSHMVKKSRLQYHLVKCAKNYKGTKVPCPYNHTEYFEPEDLISHLSLCTSRRSVEVHQYYSNKNRNDTILLKKKLPSTPVQEDNRHSDENWGFD